MCYKHVSYFYLIISKQAKTLLRNRIFIRANMYHEIQREPSGRMNRKNHKKSCVLMCIQWYTNIDLHIYPSLILLIIIYLMFHPGTSQKRYNESISMSNSFLNTPYFDFPNITFYLYRIIACLFEIFLDIDYPFPLNSAVYIYSEDYLIFSFNQFFFKHIKHIRFILYN